MFIVGWGHGNHAFVKHALRERYVPRFFLVPRTPLSTPLARSKSPHRNARHSFGCIHGGGSDVSSLDAGHATGCFRLVTETTRMIAHNLPILLLNLSIAHTHTKKSPYEEIQCNTVRGDTVQFIYQRFMRLFTSHMCNGIIL